MGAPSWPQGPSAASPGLLSSPRRRSKKIQEAVCSSTGPPVSIPDGRFRLRPGTATAWGLAVKWEFSPSPAARAGEALLLLGSVLTLPVLFQSGSFLEAPDPDQIWSLNVSPRFFEGGGGRWLGCQTRPGQ